MSIGKITIGSGEELELINGVSINDHKEGRKVYVAEVEKGKGICLCVENEPHTGRSEQNAMWLGKESFMHLMAVMSLYATGMGWDTEEAMKFAMSKDLEIQASEEFKEYISK
jgi:hypothetical protein